MSSFPLFHHRPLTVSRRPSITTLSERHYYRLTYRNVCRKQKRFAVLNLCKTLSQKLTRAIFNCFTRRFSAAVNRGIAVFILVCYQRCSSIKRRPLLCLHGTVLLRLVSLTPATAPHAYPADRTHTTPQLVKVVAVVLERAPFIPVCITRPIAWF